MTQHLSMIALVVRDYDEAIAYYTQTLGFELIEDTVLSATKRWVVVGPPGSSGRLLLAKAVGGAQESRIGDQTGACFCFWTPTISRGTTHGSSSAA